MWALHTVSADTECSFEDMQSQFNEDSYTKRTLEKHVRQCDEIEMATRPGSKQPENNIWDQSKEQVS